MEIQTPNMRLPTQEFAVIPFNPNILPQNFISPKPDNTRTNDDLLSFRQKIFTDIKEEFRSYTTEQLLLTTFLWVMTSTSFSHVVLGLEMMENTGLSNPTSPIVMSFFKYSLAICTSLSLTYADQPFKFSILRKNRYSCMFLCLPISYLLTPIGEKYGRIVYYTNDVLYMACLGGFSGHGTYGWLVSFGIYCFLQIIVCPIVVRVSISSDLVLIISVLCSFLRAAFSSDLQLLTYSSPLLCFLDKNVKKLLPVAATQAKSTLKENKKILKFIKYAIGLIGTLLFQNFFRLQTFSEVKAFMYLASSWLANLAVINASNDCGILNFLLANMIVGSTVSQSGLGLITWFTYGVCIFLHILGIKLKSLKIAEKIGELPRPPFLFWIFYCCTVIDWLANLIN